ncbi:MAG: hypothetical protein ABUL72_02625, partial [Armatimonadota bacterium]
QEMTYQQTLNAKLSSRVDLSLTNSHMRRDLDSAPQTRREVGAAIDFGKGIKLNVGQTRQIEEKVAGTQTDQFSITPGKVQDIQIDSASYTHNSTDELREQHQGSFNFHNAKSLNWGQFKDVRFQYAAETVRDSFIWQKEDRRMGIGANVRGISLDVGYRSQVTGDGYRAIDRTLKFNSDPTGKAPIRFALLYGARTLPTNEEVAVRDYSVTWQMNKGLLLEHSITTNPLQQGGTYLDTTPVDERRNNWSLKWTGDKSHKLDLSWKEIQRDRFDDALYREA